MVTITRTTRKPPAAQDKPKVIPHSRTVLRVSVKEGALAGVEQYGSVHTRGESTLRMVLDALIGLNMAGHKISKELIIHPNDRPVKDLIEPRHFYYCVAHEKDIGNVIPDFIFDAWPQSGILNYRDTQAEIIARGRQPYEDERLFWVGSFTHHNRMVFADIAKRNKQKILAMTTGVSAVLESKNYVTLPDHARYKYLIDIEGVGYSGRIPFLLATQRLLFLQERKWKGFYHFDLQPYKHFIPVKNDLSDLMAQLEFVESQGSGFYNKITDNALAFVENKLSYPKVIEALQQKILAI
ncbi:glycosyltransferase family 90 protein [Neisseria perflava]|uniref:glycosyltransferase family 90 protein n=1 Tax=Neisseria perflava TaxID=33053 RepID=UPI00209EC808|nr:glycosyltransferase family 90 protein [Neisseria perflava]MCP1659286.1 hypothetical protein [Neisseria perflava]MCP1772794.1 hypothetical protein [Neisseria perflava]